MPAFVGQKLAGDGAVGHGRPMMSAQDRTTLLRLLDWYRSAGVDAVVSDATVDWIARGDQPPGSDFAWPNRADAPHSATLARASPLPTPRPAAAPAVKQSETVQPAQSAPRAFPTAPPDAAATAAEVAAHKAGDLAALGVALAAFDGCALKATAKSLCFYRGAPHARVNPVPACWHPDIVELRHRHDSCKNPRRIRGGCAVRGFAPR